jgi:hypothetical protein
MSRVGSTILRRHMENKPNTTEHPALHVWQVVLSESYRSLSFWLRRLCKVTKSSRLA